MVLMNFVTEKLKNLAKSLPYPLYIVGGSVRDMIAGFNSEGSDVDICAPADASDFSARAEKFGFNIAAVYKNTGTVKLSCSSEAYEFTSFRSDEYVRGSHSPATVYFTDDINLDARRRDFKCNAVYLNVATGDIVDPLGGADDIDNRVISTVTDANKVFGEDGLRLMRLARICAQTGFTPTKECLEGAKANAALIDDISPERIFCEMNLLLHADKKYGIHAGQYAGLKVLYQTGVLARVFPELAAGDGMSQRKDIHAYDVLGHSLRTVGYASADVRWAALLHDVGKPYCHNTTGRFVGHEDEGARIATEILQRLKAPKKLIAQTAKLTELHMYDFRGDAAENKVRKFIIENLELFPQILHLKQADFSACKDDRTVAPTVKKFKAIFMKMRSENLPFTLKELEIKGDDLIRLGIPCESVGDVLHSLLADCAVKVVANDKNKLYVRAGKIYLRELDKDAYQKFISSLDQNS